MVLPATNVLSLLYVPLPFRAMTRTPLALHPTPCYKGWMTWKPLPLYWVWASMKDRCHNPNGRQWKDYGGRGIAVCDRWIGRVVGFQNFVADMGPRPPGTRIERIDNDGDYTPENCCWATPKEQQRNRRNTLWVTIQGIRYKAADLSDQCGLKTDTIVERAKLGLTLSEVLSTERRVSAGGLALGGPANGRRQKAKTHCPAGHPYSEENTHVSPKGWRKCRKCRAERATNARRRGA
jgi:hypothetical protein